VSPAPLLPALAATFLLAVIWLTLGWRVLRPVRDRLVVSEALSLALLAGAGLFGVAIFVVGQLWFSAAVVGALAATGLLPLASPVERRSLSAALRALRPPPILVLLPLLALAGLLLASGLARPTGDMGSDGVSYHLAGPALWLRSHRVVTALDASHTAFPVAIDALFAAGMALSNERAPGVIGGLLALVVVIQATGLARWLGASARWAPLASLLVAFMPPLLINVGWAFVDIEYAGFALAALRLSLAPELRRLRAGPLSGGLFLGLAIATKYNGLTLAATTLAIAAGYDLLTLRAGGATAARRALSAGLVGAALGAPFLVRNWVVLGVPIYPPPVALAKLMTPIAFPLPASAAFERYIFTERGSGMGRGLLDLLFLPWRFTFHTSNFHGGGGIGLAPLALFPAAWIARRTAIMRWGLLWIALTTLIWFAVQQEARFLDPVVILLTAIAVVGAEALVAAWPRLGVLAVALVVLISVTYGGIIQGRSYLGRALSAVRPAVDAARWQAEVPFTGAFAYLNAVPSPARVLVLSWSVPPYYLHHDYLKIEGLYGERPIAGVSTAAEALARVDQLGVTHVLDVVATEPPNHQAAHGFMVPMPPPQTLQLVFDSPNARVFRVVRQAPSRR
jgi:hypothetical protein